MLEGQFGVEFDGWVKNQVNRLWVWVLHKATEMPRKTDDWNPWFPTKIALKINWLVVETTPLKNMLVKMGSSSPNRDENKKIFETTT